MAAFATDAVATVRFPATPVMSAAHCAFAPAQSKAAAVAAADEFVRKDAARLRSDAQACGRSVKQRVDG